MGDALAIALLDARGFSKDQFAFVHPGGNLGRRLLLHVADVMRTGDQIPKVGPEASLHDGLVEMSRKGLGMTTLVDSQGKLLGVFTDGDLRRLLDRPIDLKTATMGELMIRGPKTVQAHALAAEAARLMETARVTGLPVLDAQGTLVGALNAHDLMRAGVM
jgi:arabinose-5-phosphate isomerase